MYLTCRPSKASRNVCVATSNAAELDKPPPIGTDEWTTALNAFPVPVRRHNKILGSPFHYLARIPALLASSSVRTSAWLQRADSVADPGLCSKSSGNSLLWRYFLDVFTRYVQDSVYQFVNVSHKTSFSCYSSEGKELKQNRNIPGILKT